MEEARAGGEEAAGAGGGRLSNIKRPGKGGRMLGADLQRCTPWPRIVKHMPGNDGGSWLSAVVAAWERTIAMYEYAYMYRHIGTNITQHMLDPVLVQPIVESNPEAVRGKDVHLASTRAGRGWMKKHEAGKGRPDAACRLADALHQHTAQDHVHTDTSYSYMDCKT